MTVPELIAAGVLFGFAACMVGAHMVVCRLVRRRCPVCWSKRTHCADSWENAEAWHCGRCHHRWVVRVNRE